MAGFGAHPVQFNWSTRAFEPMSEERPTRPDVLTELQQRILTRTGLTRETVAQAPLALQVAIGLLLDEIDSLRRVLGAPR